MIRPELPRSRSAGWGRSPCRITLPRVLLPFPTSPRPPQKPEDPCSPGKPSDPTDRPDKPRQFPCHGHRGHGRSLAAHHHAGEFAVQPHLRLARRLDHVGRLPFASLPDGLARAVRRVPVMPGGLHQDTSEVCIPGPRERSAPLFPAAGVFRRTRPMKDIRSRGEANRDRSTNSEWIVIAVSVRTPRKVFNRATAGAMPGFCASSPIRASSLATRSSC